MAFVRDAAALAVIVALIAMAAWWSVGLQALN
jgi:hypothetical protein